MKKMMRRIVSLTLALLLMLGLPLSALAADYEASDFGQLESAFSGSSNEAGDTTVNVNVTSNVDFGGSSVSTKEGWTYNVSSGNDSKLNNASFDGAGTVNVSTDISTSSGNYVALTASGDVSVTVTGDLKGSDAIVAKDNSEVYVRADENTAQNPSAVNVKGDVKAFGNSYVEVEGNLDGYNAVWTQDSSTVKVTGNIVDAANALRAEDQSTILMEGNILDASSDGISATGESSVTLTGDIAGSIETGVYANGKADVTVNGNIQAGEDDRALYIHGESHVEVTGNVSGGFTAISAYDSSTAIVQGDVTGTNRNAIDVSGSAVVDVTGNINAAESGIQVSSSDREDEEPSNAKVTVNGNITAEDNSIRAAGKSEIAVTGDVTGDLLVDDESNVRIVGDVTGNMNGYITVLAMDNSYVKVTGNVVGYSGTQYMGYGEDGVVASENATVHITGDVIGGDGYGDASRAGVAVAATDTANVTVEGSAVGGDLYGDAKYLTDTGAGVWMSGSANVTIGGNVTAGNVTGTGKTAVPGVYFRLNNDGTPGTLTVKGKVSGSNGGDAFYYTENYVDTTFDNMVTPSIFVGGYYGGVGGIFTPEQLQHLAEGIVILPPESEAASEVEDWFWLDVAAQIRNAQKGDTITVDAGVRTWIPVYIIEAVKEYGVTLVIRWDGGADITIGSDFNKAAKGGVYLLKDL